MSSRWIAILATTLGLAACDSSTSPSGTTDPAPAGSTTVTIVSGAAALTNTAFSPNPVTVPVGTTVSWLNNDSVTHTTAANDGTFSSPNVGRGRRFNFTFNSAGTFPYRCTIHPNMVGTVTVQ